MADGNCQTGDAPAAGGLADGKLFIGDEYAGVVVAVGIGVGVEVVNTAADFGDDEDRFGYAVLYSV